MQRPATLPAALLTALLGTLPGAPAARDSGAQPMSAAAFRAFSEGWTLHFEADGRPFGAERYFEGGAVLWKPEGGPCARGDWVASGNGVCFVYADLISCWLMFETARGVEAEPMAGGARIRVARRDRAAIDCAEIPAV